MKMEERGVSRQMKTVGTLDVDALYPSIRLDLAVEALEDALHVATHFSEKQIEMILCLKRICIENSVIHYRGTWYCSTLGIPTGGPESGSIANIVVYFVMEKKLLIHPDISRLNKISNRRRFLDDVWFGWLGTSRQFSTFRTALNRIGSTFGITFKGDVGPAVDFLDVSITLKENGGLETKLFIKPTDASRYLHRRSDHGSHTFRSTPFSQFRRAVVICSNKDDRIQSISYMARKFVDSGYKQAEIYTAQEKALRLDRKEILGTSPRNTEELSSQSKRQLTFVINRDNHMCRGIKKILAENKHDIDTLLGGPTQVIVAERRNSNIASMLFAKSSFSKSIVPIGVDQKCHGGNGCMTCSTMNLKRNVILWKDHPAYKTTIRLDFRCDCLTENIIYLFVCKLCKSNNSFYVGQSVNSTRGRANGHRSKFNNKAYTKSALSYHMYIDHPEHFNKKLLNFDLGVIKTTAATNLDRMEDY